MHEDIERELSYADRDDAREQLSNAVRKRIKKLTCPNCGEPVTYQNDHAQTHGPDGYYCKTVSPLTLDQLRAMSPEEVNRRIAEHCGWKRISWDGPDGPLLGYPKWLGRENEDGSPSIVPNYFAYLDAMAQAEATLTDEREREDYCQWIAKQLMNPELLQLGRATDRHFAIVTAPANVRAFAFLLAKEGAQ